MFLFIFESIGTSELILVGIVALIFLGPRKLPEMARKAGKIMSEFRGTANEFKQTWEREVNFEEESKAFNLDSIESEVVAREADPLQFDPSGVPTALPEIREVDPEAFAGLKEKTSAETPPPEIVAEDKRNWL